VPDPEPPGPDDPAPPPKPGEPIPTGGGLFDPRPLHPAPEILAPPSPHAAPRLPDGPPAADPEPGTIHKRAP
jgi:hypothetical protein